MQSYSYTAHTRAAASRNTAARLWLVSPVPFLLAHVEETSGGFSHRF